MSDLSNKQVEPTLGGADSDFDNGGGDKATTGSTGSLLTSFADLTRSGRSCTGGISDSGSEQEDAVEDVCNNENTY